jgi:N6-adenosine-specific RNA methylase IME4
MKKGNNDFALIIPEKGTPISMEELQRIEAQIADIVGSVDSIDILEEGRRRAHALETYLHDKEMQGPMLTTQRHMEGRIGQLLGPAKHGGDHMSKQPTHAEVALIGRDGDRSDFRLIALALAGECELEFPREWRRSRRSMILLIRERLGLQPPLEALPEGKFRCIVADPPWEQKAGPPFASGGTSDDLPYIHMDLDGIEAMPVAESAADDAHLWLWITNRYLEHAWRIARAWGFEPSTVNVWCKKPHGMGPGGVLKNTTEFFLFCRRGKLEALSKVDTTWFEWKRGKHSEKPEEFYDLVQKITPAPFAEKDRLELFSRKKRSGWTVWGNEVPSDPEQ